MCADATTITQHTGIGIVMVPLVGMIVMSIFGTAHSEAERALQPVEGVSWRIILGIGAVPGWLVVANWLASIHYYGRYHHIMFLLLLPRVLMDDVYTLPVCVASSFQTAGRPCSPPI